MMTSIFTILLLATGILALPLNDRNVTKRSSRISAPAGCLTVGANGYLTIASAISALGSSTNAACIFISSGTYKEQLTVTYPGSLTIYGSTSDTGTYKSNTVTITHTMSSSDAGSLDASATLNIKSNNFKLYNVNVANGYGSGAQAVALALHPLYIDV